MEVQSRVANMKEKRDKSLSILDEVSSNITVCGSIYIFVGMIVEYFLSNSIMLNSRALLQMHHSVELRLSTADKEISKAKEEKLNEENSIKKYFSVQEVIVDKIVQEVKVLELQAEENSKVITQCFIKLFLLDYNHH